MKKLYALLSFAVVFAHSPAFAGGDTSSFQAKPIQVIDSLLNAGIVALGDFDLRTIRAQLAQTQYSLQTKDFGQDEPFPMQPGVLAERLDGRFDSSNRSVVIQDGDRLIQDQNQPVFSLLLLHEALGANGYPDFCYEISVALFSLAQIQDPVQQNAFLQAITPSFSPFASALTGRYLPPGETVNNPTGTVQPMGGTMVVGGGGDLDELDVKERLITQFDQIIPFLPNGASIGMKYQKAFWIRNFLLLTNVIMSSAKEPFSVALTEVTMNRAYWLSLSEEKKLPFLATVMNQLTVSFMNQ